MKWNVEKPTRPGWYWIAGQFMHPQIIEVRHDIINGPYIRTMDRGEYSLTNKCWENYRFSDLLPEPEDPFHV